MTNMDAIRMHENGDVDVLQFEEVPIPTPNENEVQSGEQLAEMAQSAESGHLAPTVSQVFPLAEAKEAHRLSESGRVRGKLVLRIGE